MIRKGFEPPSASPAAAVLGDLPTSSRGALSLMADFFNSPVEQQLGAR
jgi:hypothetical protein